MKTRKLFIIMLIAALFVTIIGCDKAKKEEKKDTNNTKTQSSKIPIPEADKTAPMAQQDGKLPANFPDDFPIYAGATIDGKTSSYGTTENGLTYSVKWMAKADSKKVLEFYKEDLHKNGYVVTNIDEQSSGTTVIMLQESKGSILLQPKEKDTLITANFSKVY